MMLPIHANADDGCTFVMTYPQGKIVKQDGNCAQRVSPASTFKIPLAIMGFDAEILKDAHHPLLPYKDEYHADNEHDQRAVDPTIWLQYSIVWYSQQLTQKLGPEKFQRYVNQFNYGNQDVSGNPGKNDGLTQSWLFSSLQISPMEEVEFIQKFLSHNLGVSDRAYDMTRTIMPKFLAGGWQVFGKTGTGWLRDKNGEYNKNYPRGWFVGWAEKAQQKIIFAKLIIGNQTDEKLNGPNARAKFLSELPDMGL